MAELNKLGLQSENLGRVSVDGPALRDALCAICKPLAAELGGTPIVYAELGPEPVKTRYIIENLLNLRRQD